MQLTPTLSTYELGHQPEAVNPQLPISVVDNEGYYGAPLEFVYFKLLAPYTDCTIEFSIL